VDVQTEMKQLNWRWN